MNILQVEPAEGFSGGVNQTILNSIELKRRGHRVYVACVKDSAVCRALSGVADGFVFIDGEKKLKSARLISDFLKSHDIQIVHTHHSKGHSMGLLALLFRRKERLVVQRSVIFPPNNPFKYLNPRINVFVANSEAVKSVLVRHLMVPKRKIRVIYSAIDPHTIEYTGKREARKALGVEEGRFVFGVLANYSKYKGHELMLEALSRVENKENVVVVFAGRNTEMLHDTALKLGVLDNVRLLGFKNNARRLIEGFDCLVVPSLVESFPNAAIEAFFYRTPVIGTDVGGIPELLADGRGIVVKPEADELAGAMLAVYHATDTGDMTERAYEFALENLTIEKKIDRLERLYEEIIG